MANIILNRRRVRPNDKVQQKELKEARDILERPGHFRIGRIESAQDFLRYHGDKKAKPKWTLFD